MRLRSSASRTTARRSSCGSASRSTRARCRRSPAPRLGGEAVVLSTCNRTELYLAARRARRGSARSRRSLSSPASAPTSSPPRSTGCTTRRPRCTSSASRPGSTRSCPARARSSARCAPPTRPERRGRSSTGSSARRSTPAGASRVETAIGESPASVPAAAAALAQQVFGDSPAAGCCCRRRQDERGDGRNLVSRGAEIAVVANRTLERGEELARRLGARRSRSTRSAPELEHADVVVSSTSAAGLRRSPRGRRAGAPRARAGRCSSSTSPCRATSTPRSTSSTAASSTTSTTSRPSSPRRSAGRRQRGGAGRADRRAEAERFREWQASLDVVPAIASLRALAEEIRAASSRAAGSAGSPRASERRSSRYVADPRQAAAPAHGADEGGGRGSRRGGLC